MPAAATLILRHGKIVTVDRHGTIAEAVAIDGDTILHVGSTAEMQPFIGPQVVDLIAREVAAKPPGEWLVTAPVGTPPYHFDVAEMLAKNHVPTRWDLDAVSVENPVYIQAIWGYWGWPPLDLEAWQTSFDR